MCWCIMCWCFGFRSSVSSGFFQFFFRVAFAHHAFCIGCRFFFIGRRDAFGCRGCRHHAAHIMVLFKAGRCCCIGLNSRRCHSVFISLREIRNANKSNCTQKGCKSEVFFHGLLQCL